MDKHISSTTFTTQHLPVDAFALMCTIAANHLPVDMDIEGKGYWYATIVETAINSIFNGTRSIGECNSWNGRVITMGKAVGLPSDVQVPNQITDAFGSAWTERQALPRRTKLQILEEIESSKQRQFEAQQSTLQAREQIIAALHGTLTATHQKQKCQAEMIGILETVIRKLREPKRSSALEAEV